LRKKVLKTFTEGLEISDGVNEEMQMITTHNYIGI